MNYRDALTIFIPLWGRDNCTQDILRFMTNARVPFKIIMADGAGEDKSSWINTEAFPNLRLEYKHYGLDSDMNKFMRKMYLALSSITTPLTVMVDNDDFFHLDGLIAGVKFLADNDDFASFRENVAEHHTGNPIYRAEPITLDSPEKRITQLFDLGNEQGGINSAWHDVCRTHIFKKMFKIMFKSGNQDFQLSHSANKYWSLFYGKSYKENDIPYMTHVAGQSLVQGRGLYSKYKDWVNDVNFKDSMAVIISSVKGLLKDRDDETIRKIQELIMLDPYNLGGHQMPDQDQINDIFELSQKYDTMVVDVLNEEDTTPSCFTLE